MFVPTHINTITAEDGSKAIVIGLDLIVPLDATTIPEIVSELLEGLDLSENTTQDQQEDTHE